VILERRFSNNPKDVRSWEFWKEKIKEGTAELESASTTRAEVEEYYNDVSYLEKMGAIYKLKRPPTVLFRKSSKIYNLQELKKVLMESGMDEYHASNLANDALARVGQPLDFANNGVYVLVKSASDNNDAFYPVDFGSGDLPICRNKN